MIFVWRNLVSQTTERSHPQSLYLRMFERCLKRKTTALLVFFLWLGKSLKSFWIIDFLRNVVSLIFNMVLGLLDQLQIFWLVYLIELLGFLIGLKQFAVALDIFKAFNKVWHAALILKLKPYAISARFLALFHPFPVIDDFAGLIMQFFARISDYGWGFSRFHSFPAIY